MIQRIQSIPVRKLKEQSLKKEVCLEVPKLLNFLDESSKDTLLLKLTTMTFENDMSVISAAI